MAASLIFLLSGEVVGIYRKERCSTADRELLAVFANWIMTLSLLAGVSFFTRQGSDFARGSMLVWIVLGGSSVAFVRMILRVIIEGLYSRGVAVTKCAIVGVNPLGLQLFENIKRQPGSGLQVVGFFDDRAKQRNLDLVAANDLQVARMADLVEQVKKGEVSTVFLTLPMRAEGRIDGCSSS